MDSRYALVKIVDGLAKNREGSNKKEKVLFMRGVDAPVDSFYPYCVNATAQRGKTQAVQNPDAQLWGDKKSVVLNQEGGVAGKI